MLGQLDTLFAQLTLGGLRRWATWGAQAHRTAFEAQVAYFGLASKESLAILQKERKGTLLVDVQRRINMYLRALWARDFYMRPTAGDFETRTGYQPFIEDYTIHLPDAYDSLTIGDHNIDSLTVYRAAAAHSAAHIMYTRLPISADDLTPLQIALIGIQHFAQDRSAFVLWWMRRVKRVPEEYWGVIPLCVDQSLHVLWIQIVLLLGTVG